MEEPVEEHKTFDMGDAEASARRRRVTARTKLVAACGKLNEMCAQDDGGTRPSVAVLTRHAASVQTAWNEYEECFMNHIELLGDAVQEAQQALFAELYTETEEARDNVTELLETRRNQGAEGRGDTFNFVKAKRDSLCNKIDGILGGIDASIGGGMTSSVTIELQNEALDQVIEIAEKIEEQTTKMQEIRPKEGLDFVTFETRKRIEVEERVAQMRAMLAGFAASLSAEAGNQAQRGGAGGERSNQTQYGSEDLTVSSAYQDQDEEPADVGGSNEEAAGDAGPPAKCNQTEEQQLGLVNREMAGAEELVKEEASHTEKEHAEQDGCNYVNFQQLTDAECVIDTRYIDGQEDLPGWDKQEPSSDLSVEDWQSVELMAPTAELKDEVQSEVPAKDQSAGPAMLIGPEAKQKPEEGATNKSSMKAINSEDIEHKIRISCGINIRDLRSDSDVFQPELPDKKEEKQEAAGGAGPAAECSDADKKTYDWTKDAYSKRARPAYSLQERQRQLNLIAVPKSGDSDKNFNRPGYDVKLDPVREASYDLKLVQGDGATRGGAPAPSASYLAGTKYRDKMRDALITMDAFIKMLMGIRPNPKRPEDQRKYKKLYEASHAIQGKLEVFINQKESDRRADDILMSNNNMYLLFQEYDEYVRYKDDTDAEDKTELEQLRKKGQSTPRRCTALSYVSYVAPHNLALQSQMYPAPEVEEIEKERANIVLLPCQKLRLCGDGFDTTVLWDYGSEISLVTREKAEAAGWKGREVKLALHTAGGGLTERISKFYRVYLRSQDNIKYGVYVYEVEEITQTLQPVDASIALKCWPWLRDTRGYTPSGYTKGYAQIEPPTGKVEMLIGVKHAGAFPYLAQPDSHKSGNLCILTSNYGHGYLLTGCHSELKPGRAKEAGVERVIHPSSDPRFQRWCCMHIQSQRADERPHDKEEGECSDSDDGEELIAKDETLLRANQERVQELRQEAHLAKFRMMVADRAINKQSFDENKLIKRKLAEDVEASTDTPVRRGKSRGLEKKYTGEVAAIEAPTLAGPTTEEETASDIKEELGPAYKTVYNKTAKATPPGDEKLRGTGRKIKSSKTGEQDFQGRDA